MECVEWVRGPMIGRGSFGTVNLATPIKNSSEFSSKMVVKSSEVSCSGSLRTENEALTELGDCSEIVRLLGDGFSSENGKILYNLFFEYAEKGSLESELRKCGGKFKICDVKKYTQSILKGLCYVHGKGYIHCDIKLQNTLLFCNGVVKLADFGLSRKIDEKKGDQLIGTPMYMSPELVARGEAGPPADVWALGCCVAQMVSGKSAWDVSPECDARALICRIGMGVESPEVPEGLCSQGKDFVEKCFIKDPKKRWSARMLLEHPFLSGLEGDESEICSISPRDPFEFCGLESLESTDSNPINFGWGYELCDERECDDLDRSFIRNRVGDLASNVEPDWSDTDGWVDVRWFGVRFGVDFFPYCKYLID